MMRATAGRPYRPHWSWPFPRRRFGFVLHRQAGAAPARFQRRQRRRRCNPDSSPRSGAMFGSCWGLALALSRARTRGPSPADLRSAASRCAGEAMRPLPRPGEKQLSSRASPRLAKSGQYHGWIVHPGPDLPGFSSAGQGVHARAGDSLATRVLGFHSQLWRFGPGLTWDLVPLMIHGSEGQDPPLRARTGEVDGRGRAVHDSTRQGARVPRWLISGGWYLKLTVDDEMPEVAITSFHPLEAPLRTRGGEVKL